MSGAIDAEEIFTVLSCLGQKPTRQEAQVGASMSIPQPTGADGEWLQDLAVVITDEGTDGLDFAAFVDMLSRGSPHAERRLSDQVIRVLCCVIETFASRCWTSGTRTVCSLSQTYM